MIMQIINRIVMYFYNLSEIFVNKKNIPKNNAPVRIIKIKTV